LASLAILLSACGVSARATAPPAPAPVQTAAPGWRQAGANAVRSSGVPAGLQGPQAAQLRWKRKLGGSIAPGPVVGADGTVYAASNAGDLHALDPLTGKDKWRFDGGGSYGIDLSTVPALLDSGILLWPGPQSTLYALRARDGHLLWRFPMTAMVLSPAATAGPRVYVQDQNGELCALAPDTAGAHRAWCTELGEGSYSSPALAADGTIVAGTSHHLIGLTDGGASSRERWRWTAPAEIEVSPAVAPDGTVVVGLNDPYVYGVRAGRTVWRFTKDDWSYSSAAITADGTVYLGDHTGRLDVLEAATGRVIRRVELLPVPADHPSGIGVWTSPAVDAVGDVYVGTAAGGIYGVGPDGRLLFGLATGGAVFSYPALGPDGTLYIGSSDGFLRAVRDNPDPTG
jgi:outer membrane protein assembly factor BamB